MLIFFLQYVLAFNIALGKTTKQSSTWNTAVSGHAVDGETTEWGTEVVVICVLTLK